MRRSRHRRAYAGFGRTRDEDDNAAIVAIESNQTAGVERHAAVRFRRFTRARRRRDTPRRLSGR